MLSSIRRRFNPSMEELFSSFLKKLEAKGNAPVSINNYRLRLKSFFELHGHKLPSELSHVDGDEWLLKLRNDGLARTSIAAYTQALQTFERYLREWHTSEVGKRPFSLHLKTGKTVNLSRARVVLTNKEAARMINVCRNMFATGDCLSMSQAVLVFWIFATGSRNGEVCNQTVDRLSLDSPARIKDTSGSWQNIYTAVVEGKAQTGKSTADTVQYREPMAQMLRIWLANKPTPRYGKSNDFVFVKVGDCGNHWGDVPKGCPVCKPHGQQIDGRFVRNACKVVAKKAEIKSSYNPHDLRHWFLTYYAEKVGDIEIVKRRARHKHVSTTMLYTHRKETRLMEAVANVDPLSDLG